MPLLQNIYRLRAWLGLLLALGLGSCGWHTGLVPPDHARTVGVEIFRTPEEVLERNLEPILHRELSRAVTDLVDAPLVSARDADLVLRGYILRYQRRGGIRNSEHEMIETGVHVTARAELVERTTGRIVRPAVQAGLWSGFVIEGLDAEAQARDRVVRNIAETLVLDLFRPRREDAPEENRGDTGG